MDSDVDAQLEALIGQHADRAFAIARRMVGNDADAGDIVQEAFLRVMRYFKTYDPSLPFEAWLGQIIRNVYLRSLRLEARRRSVSLSKDDGDDSLSLEEVLEDPAPGPQELLAAKDTRDEVQEALVLLSAPLRMAVILVDLEGLGREAAAQSLGCSLSALDVRLHRARARLRELLGPGREGKA